MSSVNYPTDKSYENISIVNSEIIKAKMVKISTVDNNENLIHSFLNSVYKTYQNEKELEKKNTFCKIFTNQITDYIKSDSEESDEQIYNKFKKSSLESELKDKFSLSLLGKKRSIFNAVIVKKNTDDDFINLNLAYNLFSKKTKDDFLPTSKFFSILNEKFMVDFINQRFLIKYYEEKIKNINNSENSEDYMEEVNNLQRIVDHNSNRCNNLEPLNFINILNSEKKDNELLLYLFSLIFKINIFICRSWSNDVTVVKEIQYSHKSPCIVLFKYSGKVSVTGTETSTHYQTGGFMLGESEITTILNFKNHKTFINRLRENLNSGIEKFLMGKYHSYLGKLGGTVSLEKIDETYDDQIDEEENLSSSDEEEVEEEISSEIEEEVLKDEIREDIEIPYFIKNYSDLELIKLYKLFIDPNPDLNTLTRLAIEIRYKDYLQSEKDNDVSSIIQDLKEKIV